MRKLENDDLYEFVQLLSAAEHGASEKQVLDLTGRLEKELLGALIDTGRRATEK